MKIRKLVFRLFMATICLLYSSRILIKSIQIYQFERTPLESIEDYYLDINLFKDSLAVQFDTNQVVVLDYSKVSSRGVDNTLSYNPIAISLMGLKLLQERDTSRFMAQSKWMVEHQSEAGFWFINHDKWIGKNVLKAPWSSSLAQGLGISLLTRAFLNTKDSTYYDGALRGISPFTKSIDDGGILFKDSTFIFYEEYPLIQNPTHVLNGHIYSLFGLHDLAYYFDSKEAKQLFDEGVKSLIIHLDQYDAGFWSYYSLNSETNLENHYNLASPLYQKLHVIQLQGLFLITEEMKFKEKKESFEHQLKNSWFNLIVLPAYVVYIDFVRLKRNAGI